MRIVLLLVIAGLSLTLLGFAIVFGSLGGGLPLEAGFVGFAMVVLGPLLFVGGLLAYALRRPTPRELASQKAGEHQTWHFRPVGLLILVIGVAVFVVFGNWAEQHVPSINSGDEPLSGYIFALVWLALLSFRKVRDLIFYTGDIPAAKVAEDE